MRTEREIWERPVLRRVTVALFLPFAVLWEVGRTLWYAAIETCLLCAEDAREEIDTGRRLWRGLPPGTPLDD